MDKSFAGFGTYGFRKLLDLTSNFLIRISLNFAWAMTIMSDLFDKKNNVSYGYTF